MKKPMSSTKAQIRANLTPAEEAAHMGRRKQLYERLYPETKHGAVGRRGKRSQNATSSEPADAFIDDIAKKTGKHRATVARKTARARKVAVLSDVVGTCLDNGAELDALSKLPEAEQRSLAEAAKRGEQVSAITTVNTPADRKMNDVIGEVRSSRRKKAAPVRKLDPLAWTMSTVEERIDFINAIGRRDIEDVLDAIEPTPTVQETEATRSVMAHEPAEPGPVTPEKFETQNTMCGEGGFDPLFQNEVRRTTPEIVPEHMARNTNPQEAVTPLETQNTVPGEGGYDCKLDSRFQKEVCRTTPEIVTQGLPGGRLEHDMARNTNPQEALHAPLARTRTTSCDSRTEGSPRKMGAPSPGAVSGGGLAVPLTLRRFAS
jgi:hypothetical protein